MELVQKLMKKTSKYLFYSPLTEKVLTECPCSIGVVCRCYSYKIIHDRCIVTGAELHTVFTPTPTRHIWAEHERY